MYSIGYWPAVCHSPWYAKKIDELIEEEVRKLGSPKGGLEFVAGIYPPTPPGNIDALFEALEKYRAYWWD